MHTEEIWAEKKDPFHPAYKPEMAETQLTMPAKGMFLLCPLVLWQSGLGWGSEFAPARRTQQPSTPLGAQACGLPPVIQPRIRFPINCVDYLHLVLEGQNSLQGQYGDVSAEVIVSKWAVYKKIF